MHEMDDLFDWLLDMSIIARLGKELVAPLKWFKIE